MRILLVEDDEAVAEVLVKKLREQHYQIDLATDGQIGWEFAETYDYDLVLLDVMLPILDGISFCKQRRAKGDRTPILLLTALDNSTSKIAGLDAGADDYVIKPFDLDELMARIRALLRRGIPSSPVMEWGKLQLDPSSCRVTYDGQLIHLTSKEYGLLEIFLRNNQRIFSLNALIGHLWSFDEFPLENTVRAHVKGLRQKLKKAGVGDVIETVYGLGYRLREKQEDTTRNAEVTETLIFQSSNNSLSDFARSTAQNLSGLPQSVTPKLAEAWNRYQDKYLDRLNVIDLALAAAKQSILSDDLRQQAWRQAHTLTGSLGSFGFDEASRLARKIEQVFKAEGKIGCEQVEPVTMWLKQLRDELDQPISTLGLDAKTLDAKILDAKTDNSKKAPDTIASQPTYLLIVDDDTELADQLVTEALAWGMRTTSVDHPDAAREFIRHTQPDIVLLDLCFSDSPERGFELLAELATHQPPIPVFVFTAQEDFADRVRVAQLGGRGFCRNRYHLLKCLRQFIAFYNTHLDQKPLYLSLIQTLKT